MSSKLGIGGHGRCHLREEARQTVQHRRAAVDGKRISVTSILMYAMRALHKIRRSKVLWPSSQFVGSNPAQSLAALGSTLIPPNLGLVRMQSTCLSGLCWILVRVEIKLNSTPSKRGLMWIVQPNKPLSKGSLSCIGQVTICKLGESWFSYLNSEMKRYQSESCFLLPCVAWVTLLCF